MLSIVLTSCKKEDPKADDFQAKFKEKNTLKISPALKSNTDSEAQTAYSYSNALKQNIEGYSELFNIPEDAEWVAQKTAASNATGSWTWSYGTYTVLFNLTETATKYEFNYDYTYNGSSFYTLSGWENIAHTEGHYEASYTGYNSLTMDWDQTTSGYHVIMDYTGYGLSVLTYEGNYNNDGSGNISVANSTSTNVIYSASWNINGNGTVTYYDSNGIPTNTYTF